MLVAVCRARLGYCVVSSPHAIVGRRAECGMRRRRGRSMRRCLTSAFFSLSTFGQQVSADLILLTSGRLDSMDEEEGLPLRWRGRLVSRLREMRIEAGLTQMDLAARIEKDQAHISRYESGQRKLDVLEVREICQAIGVAWAEFVKRVEKALK
jgi:DNA-binding XRE family transcriptional regulator